MKLVILLLPLLFFICGCGASSAKLIKRAAFDLDCPVSNIEIVDLDGLSKGVKGCGKRATYVESCSVPSRAANTCTWVLNTNLEEIIK